MRDTCVQHVRFLYLHSVPEQVVELRTAAASLGCLQGTTWVLPTTWPKAVLLCVPLPLQAAATWFLGFSHHEVLEKDFKTNKKELRI